MKRFFKQSVIVVLALGCYILFPFVWVFSKLLGWAFDLDD